MSQLLPTSASQYKTFEMCPRKWFLEKLGKLPGKESRATIIGTAGHACYERYLRGEDPFPEGWTTIEDERAGTTHTLTSSEAWTVEQLVRQGIDHGYVSRSRDDEVEKYIELEVMDGVLCRGYVDLWCPNEVHDHKFNGSSRYWMSEKALKEDIQMGVYAKAKRDELLAEGRDVKGIMVRHNQHTREEHKIRADDAVQQTPAWLTNEDIDKTWERVQGLSREMLEVRDTPLEDWETIEGPRKPNGCSQYGGCAYRELCGGMHGCGREALEEYRSINERRAAESDSQPQYTRTNLANTTQGTTNLKHLGKLLGVKPQASSPSPAPASKAESLPKMMGGVRTADKDERPVAPWAFDRCNVAGCNGKGYMPSGDVCRVCDTMTADPSSNYIVEYLGEGRIKWTRAVQDEQVEDMVSTPRISVDTDLPSVLILAPNCMAVPRPEGGVYVHRLEDLVELAKEALREKFEVEEFEHIHRTKKDGGIWDRRDLLAGTIRSHVKQAEWGPGVHILTGNSGRDMDAVMEALRPLTSEVRGVA